MNTVNIYALTRINELRDLSRLERQMSKRPYFLQIKNWEIQGMLALCEHLTSRIGNADMLDFFYSFTIPRLGKEFDLLRINEDTVINIELKSRPVSNDRIRYQLGLNRNYLASLNRSIRSYTYISSEDRLVRLSNSGNLIEEDWDILCRDIIMQRNCVTEGIERFFKEDKYLISPLTDPERFLKGSYFLTSQQKDIKKQILARISSKGIQGFTGLPGTGKTLLLYDIAMEVTSSSKRACVLHFGSFPDEMKMLDLRLKRIDFFPCSGLDSLPDIDGYDYIFVDEGHRIKEKLLHELTVLNSQKGIPAVISYDFESMISPKERPEDSGGLIDSLPDIIKYRLTNRIRMNSELSSYICCMMHLKDCHRLRSYPSVMLCYANNEQECDLLLTSCINGGYTYISDNSRATCREFEKVVMLIDDSFSYDSEGYLRCANLSEYGVRRLFHGLNRAKTGLAIIVLSNPEVFDVLLSIAQGD